jgi:hypothetical protein
MPKPKPRTRSAWKNGYMPTWKDRHIETAWLKEHWGYGGKIHEETARAIAAALKVPTSRSVGHALYFKLFAEFANALEIAGAWGWVIRTRRDNQLLLDAFLTYRPGAPREFYLAARRNRSGSLTRLLRLPAEDKVVEALGAAIPEWTRDECRQAMTDCVKQAEFLASRYFAQDEIVLSTYDRAKQGATMLHDESLTPREFWVLAPHLDIAGPRDKARYDLPKFTVNRQMIEAAVRNVELAGSMIRYLAGLARALSDACLLYPRRARYAGRPATVTVTDTRSFPPESNLARSVPTAATTITT